EGARGLERGGDRRRHRVERTTGSLRAVQGPPRPGALARSCRGPRRREMNCAPVESLLSDHLEGLLSAREASAVAAHLRSCPACRRLQAAMEALGPELRALPVPLPSQDLGGRIIAQWTGERGTGVSGSATAARSRGVRNGRRLFELPYRPILRRRSPVFA